MEATNANMGFYLQELQGEPQGGFESGNSRIEYLGDIEIPPFQEGQGNLAGEFLVDVDARQYWGTGAGELQGGFEGVQRGNEGEVLALGGLTGHGALLAAPIAADLPAAHSSCLTVPQTPISLDGLGFPSMEDPTNLAMAPPLVPMHMYAVAPLMAPANYSMAPPMAPPHYPVAPSMAPIGYMITTLVTPLMPAITPVRPMAFSPTGSVYQIVGDDHSGLTTLSGI